MPTFDTTGSLAVPISICGYAFSGPFASASTLDDRAGVYLVLCRRGGESRLIDVGESARIRSRAEDHDRRGCWRRHCDGVVGYAALYTPGLGPRGRRQIEGEVRERHEPPCGRV